MDTDALSHLGQRDPVGESIQQALDRSPDQDIRIAVVSAYEMLNGAIARINLLKKGQKDLKTAFHRLLNLVEFLADWRGKILPFDASVEPIYRAFAPRLRQELKEDARIAAVALAHGASVWTCNTRDYAKVPGLDVVDARTGLRAP